MSHDNLILEAIKKTLKEGQATVNLNEASALTGSGSGVGGNIVYDDAFAALRLGNPIRQLSRVVPCKGSDMAFVAKVGNATNQTNPWGYGVNIDDGTPDTATNTWQISVKCLNATLPIRSAVMDDINGLESAVVEDLMMEFASSECASMTQNSDLSGSTTTAYGGTYGLRGLDSYGFSTTAASYGTSGVGPTNGYHTILGIDVGSALTYNQLVSLLSSLPPQYWHMEGTAWMMHPLTIQTIRELRDTQQLPVFLDVGLEGEEYLWGIRLVANSYMDYIDGSTLVGDRFIYLANWPQFYTIGDQEVMSIKLLDQTYPGFVNIWAEKRVVSSIRNPFAGVCLGVAPTSSPF